MNKRKFLKVSALSGLGLALSPTLLSSCDSSKKKDSTKEDTSSDADDATGLVFELPPLPYAYDALEKAVDKMTMEIHHGKHHQGYVNKLTKAIQSEGIKKVKTLEELLSMDQLPTSIQNNGGGHFNHSLYWKILSPDGVAPSKDMNDLLKKHFQSKTNFEEQFIKAGLGVFGSGWAWLCQDEKGGLFITSTHNQDNPLMKVAEKQGKPLLGIDVWEHAYYLKYQNLRKTYLTNTVQLINWKMVEEQIG